MTCFYTFLGVLKSFERKPVFTCIIYAIWIKKKILPKNWLFQGFFHIFICWKKTKKNTFFIWTIFFFSKIAQITYFYAFIVILRQYIYFSLKPHTWPFFNVFRRFTTFKGKPSLLRKKIWFYTKSHFLNNFLLNSMFWLKTRK